AALDAEDLVVVALLLQRPLPLRFTRCERRRGRSGGRGTGSGNLPRPRLAAAAGGSTRGAVRRLVEDDFGQDLRRLAELLQRLGALADARRGQRLAGGVDDLLDRDALLLVEHAPELRERAHVRLQETLEARLDPEQLRPLLVVLGVPFGVLDDLRDLPIRQAPGGRDHDLLLLLRGHVARPDVHDAVAVDVEGDLDLGHALRGRRDADQLEAAQRLVVGGDLA